MLYYYAHTGHKIGLDRAKRGAAVIKALKEAHIEAQLLVNDFRAGVALKEHGISEYVTIETIQDIDAIAQTGDSVIIDSDEDDHGRLVKYVSDFKQVWRFAHDSHDRSVHGEILFRPDCDSDECLEAVIIDTWYFEEGTKEDRLLFFLGDSDHDKTVLGHEAFFNAFEMELLLGHYFFVKYEEDLAKVFTQLHEPEEYIELIRSSSTVITASSQTALEAKASGAKAVYLDIGKASLYPPALLQQYGVDVVQGFDVEAVKNVLTSAAPKADKQIKKLNINKIAEMYKEN